MPARASVAAYRQTVQKRLAKAAKVRTKSPRHLAGALLFVALSNQIAPPNKSASAGANAGLKARQDLEVLRIPEEEIPENSWASLS